MWTSWRKKFLNKKEKKSVWGERECLSASHSPLDTGLRSRGQVIVDRADSLTRSTGTQSTARRRPRRTARAPRIPHAPHAVSKVTGYSVWYHGAEPQSTDGGRAALSDLRSDRKTCRDTGCSSRTFPQVFKKEVPKFTVRRLSELHWPWFHQQTLEVFALFYLKISIFSCKESHSALIIL